jgi:glycosyltransferase involved in cell wall biosynthesis
MKVLLVTSSYPPDVCGTAEYTVRLCEALKKIGVDAQIFYRTDWSLRQIPNLFKDLRAAKADVIHTQYPQSGQGSTFGAQALELLLPSVATLHEVNDTHFLRQITLLPYLLRSRRILFTNEYERRYVKRFAPWIERRSSVIPVGCGIPIAAPRQKIGDTITCFGIIRPTKGLEDVIAMARLLHESGSVARVRIVGALMPRFVSYFEDLRAQSLTLPIDWMVGLDDTRLSEVLAESTMAYMPIADGAAERRTSLIAMLMNKSCVVTTRGSFTPDDMHGAMIFAQTPAEAAAHFLRLLAHPAEVEEVAQRGFDYAQKFDWELIAKQHQAVYESVLQSRRGSAARIKR